MAIATGDKNINRRRLITSDGNMLAGTMIDGARRRDRFVTTPAITTVARGRCARQQYAHLLIIKSIACAESASSHAAAPLIIYRLMIAGDDDAFKIHAAASAKHRPSTLVNGARHINMSYQAQINDRASRQQLFAVSILPADTRRAAKHTMLARTESCPLAQTQISARHLEAGGAATPFLSALIAAIAASQSFSSIRRRARPN